ncbi:MAG: amidohydrolase family protein, partial [Bacteroidetes bacterium]|nr:amidohydrolase family protein [Bacteroidota bacterium]
MRLLALFASLLLFSVGDSNNTLPICIVNANVLDVESGKWLKTNITISGNTITDVSTNKPEKAQFHDFEGRFIIPGLVDGHMHFFQSGGLFTRPDIADLRHIKSYEEEQSWINENHNDLFKRYLACGITTVIDVGGPLSNFALRKQHSNADTLPDAYVAGPLISTYQPAALGDKDPPILKAHTIDEAKEFVWQQAKFQPDFIKVWYIVTPDNPAEKSFEMVKAVGDLCDELNLKFAVHATQLQTAKLAIKAGADLLVHSVDDELVDKEFINLMKKNKVSYIPTLQVYQNYQRTFAQDFDYSLHEYRWSHGEAMNSLFQLKTLEKPTLNPRLKMLVNQTYQPTKRDTIMSQNLQKIYKAGINIIAGTDAGNIGTHHGSSLLKELVMMNNSGMSNLDVLKSATCNASALLKNFSGKIEVGSKANLIVLKNDPLKDLYALQEIVCVYNKGVKHTAEILVPRNAEQLAQEQLMA